MGEWSDAIADVNSVVMGMFSQPYLYTSVADETEYPIDGILDESHLNEPDIPGAGRYVKFLMPVDELTFPPRRGDTITIGPSVYDIVEAVADEYQSYNLMLRKAGE